MKVYVVVGTWEAWDYSENQTPYPNGVQVFSKLEDAIDYKDYLEDEDMFDFVELVEKEINLKSISYE